MSDEICKIAINLELDQNEMRELNEVTDRIESGKNTENKEETLADKGLHRNRYRITCEARDRDGNEVSWVEKAYGSALALAAGAVVCQAKVGGLWGQA